MSNKRLPMRKTEEILRLKHVYGLSEREVARSCQVNRSLNLGCFCHTPLLAV